MSGMTQAQGEALIAAREREKRIAADREHRDRRERIATAAMQGVLASGRYYQKVNVAQEAVEYADALMRELDKKEDKP